MTADNLTIKGQEALQKSTQLAQARGQQAVDSSHLLLAALRTDESVMSFLLGKAGANVAAITKQTETLVDNMPKVDGGGNPYPNNDYQAALRAGEAFAKTLGDEYEQSFAHGWSQLAF